MNRLLPLALILAWSGCAGISVPPKPDLPQSVSPAIKALKLRIAAIEQGGEGAYAQPLRTALEQVLAEAGIALTSDPAAADGNLVAEMSTPVWTFTPHETHLTLRSPQGRVVDQFDYTGGSIGSNLHRQAGVYRQICEGIAYNLVAKLLASSKVADFARERAKLRPAAVASGAVDKATIKDLVAESLREEKTAEDASIVSDVDSPKFRQAENSSNFAVVVGVEKYANELPAARFAERDAKAVRAHLVALGYPERNIKVLDGSRAVRSALEAYLEDWLPKSVNEDSTVFFYFSGHGAPDPVSGQAYLVPWDGDPSYLDRTGFPLKRLYSDLNALKAKRVLVALDSCFSGAGGRSVLPHGARPLVNKVDVGARNSIGKLVVLTASAGNQISGVSDAQGHGLFTYYFLRGLGGPAARADGAVTARSLFDYLSPKVEDEASRANRGQSPQLITAEDGADLRLR